MFRFTQETIIREQSCA